MSGDNPTGFLKRLSRIVTLGGFVSQDPFRSTERFQQTEWLDENGWNKTIQVQESLCDCGLAINEKNSLLGYCSCGRLICSSCTTKCSSCSSSLCPRCIITNLFDGKKYCGRCDSLFLPLFKRYIERLIE